MTGQKFTYELDEIENEVEVSYEGSKAGKSIFSYEFDQPLDSVTVANEEDPWRYALRHLHNETRDFGEQEKMLGDLAKDYFGGEVELDVHSDSYVEVELPENIESHRASSQDTADWIVRHLDEIEDRYAAINNISIKEPEKELEDWIAEQTGEIETNR